jgi:hypothetical protein
MRPALARSPTPHARREWRACARGAASAPRWPRAPSGSRAPSPVTIGRGRPDRSMRPPSARSRRPVRGRWSPPGTGRMCIPTGARGAASRTGAARDEAVRFEGSSGGAISALLIHALESGAVDRSCTWRPIRPIRRGTSPAVSRTAAEVIAPRRLALQPPPPPSRASWRAVAEGGPHGLRRQAVRCLGAAAAGGDRRAGRPGRAAGGVVLLWRDPQPRRRRAYPEDARRGGRRRSRSSGTAAAAGPAPVWPSPPPGPRDELCGQLGRSSV